MLVAGSETRKVVVVVVGVEWTCLGLLHVGFELCAGEGADYDDGAKGGRD